MEQTKTIVDGLKIGAALAMIISWSLNHSIGWAIWHGILGWLYVIYHWVSGVY